MDNPGPFSSSVPKRTTTNPPSESQYPRHVSPPAADRLDGSSDGWVSVADWNESGVSNPAPSGRSTPAGSITSHSPTMDATPSGSIPTESEESGSESDGSSYVS